MNSMHRKIKNVVKNFTPPEIKVREATSNDPWGPSISLMSEIAEMTYDVLMCSEIMPMIWKRINDSGKNWRHVYKAIVLLEFLVRSGHERIVRQCQDNIVLIQTLRDFQHFENGQDNGNNVRESAKLLYNLLKDDERLKNERIKAANARSRFGGLGTYVAEIETISPPSSSINDSNYRPFTTEEVSRLEDTFVPRRNATMCPAAVATPAYTDAMLPQNMSEEDLQLQMALQMSKQQHEKEMEMRKGDEIKLQMVIEESKKTAQKERTWQKPLEQTTIEKPIKISPKHELAMSISDPWAIPNPSVNDSSPNKTKLQPQAEKMSTNILDLDFDNHASATLNDPSGAYALKEMAPWEECSAKFSEPRYYSNSLQSDKVEKWLKNSPTPTNLLNDNDFMLYDNSTADDIISISTATNMDFNNHLETTNRATKKLTPEQFLGPNAKLVDFDDLVSKPKQSETNPFAMSSTSKSTAVNPFVVKAQEDKSKRIPLNQLQSGSIFDAELSFTPNNIGSSNFNTINNSQMTFTPTYGNNQSAFSMNQSQTPMFNGAPMGVVYATPSQPIIQNQCYNPFLQ